MFVLKSGWSRNPGISVSGDVLPQWNRTAAVERGTNGSDVYVQSPSVVAFVCQQNIARVGAMDELPAHRTSSVSK